jgi:hypothetical protein
MTDKGNSMLKAGIELAKNSNIKVYCSNCQDSNLNVFDVFFDLSQPNLGGERHLICPKCEKSESILYRRFVENFGVGTRLWACSNEEK